MTVVMYYRTINVNEPIYCLICVYIKLMLGRKVLPKTDFLGFCIFPALGYVLYFEIFFETMCVHLGFYLIFLITFQTLSTKDHFLFSPFTFQEKKNENLYRF